MKKLCALLAFTLALAMPAQAAQVKFGNASVHDPSVLYDGGTYYIYGSHMQAAKSVDLQDWKLFSKLDKCALRPDYALEFKEALTFAEAGTFWAPDVIRLADGRYYMYYCCCEGSKPLAALGVAVADSPEGPFENIQILVRSGAPGYDATKLPNAIDPCVFFDADGRLWMVYSSYSGGIFLLELDPATGLILDGQEPYGIHLLGGNHSCIEAPYMVYNEATGYYYLFLSFGGLGVNDGYNMRVCRSKNVEGPYEDALGHDMRDCACQPGNFWNNDDIAPYAINLGTRGPENARDIVEYANHKGGSRFSDMRVANGAKEPFGIKLWCLGNEMDGPWQMGHKTAYEYGRTANEAAKMMKWVDPDIELVACGSSSSEMPTFGDWELTMLDECYDNVDYVSLHRYYGNPTNDTPGFLARTMDLDDFIKSVVSMCDAVKGKRHSKKRVNLSFDEWNVWYHSNEQDKEVWKRGKWGQALPILEDVYNFEDALLVGSMLITFLRNADRVKVACMAQLVNVIAPIMTRNGGGCWAQTIFYPYKHASRYGRGTSLRAQVDTPVYDCKDYEGVPVIDATATQSEDGGVTVFCVNRDMKEDFELEIDLRSFGEMKLGEHILLHHDDVKAVNTEAAPDTVAPVAGPGGSVDGGRASVRIPALSWNVIRFEKA